MPLAKRWCVYILECGDGSLYTGITNDLAQRLVRHQSGRGAAYTRSRRPVRVVYSEKAKGKGPALSREAAIKKLPRRDKLTLIRAAARPSRERGSARRAAQSDRAARRSSR